MIPSSFWADVEKPMKYVQYGDTDSIYIALDRDETDNIEDIIANTNKVSKEINDQIVYFMETCLLPKLGVEPQYNETFFKTELIADAIMFLDIKKNYAFRELVDKGKVHDTPVVVYKGIPVVRNNISKFTKSFIRTIVEDIAIADGLTKEESIKKLHATAKAFWDKLQEDCSNFKFDDIGIPCKWGSGYTKEPFQVIAMRTYNTISETDVFTPSTSGICVPIKITNGSTFATKINALKNRTEFCLGSSPIQNITYIALPYNRDQQRIKNIMTDFGISIDVTEYWNKLYNKVAKRIVDTIKINA